MSIEHDIVHQALLGITDRHTKKSYKQSISIFCNWAEDNDITKFKDMQGRRIDVLNEYVKSLEARGYSAGSIHTIVAPVCKGLQIPMGQIDKPRRKASYISKRRVSSSNLQGKRELTQSRFRRAVELAEAVGARRAELGKLTYRDLLTYDESGYRSASIHRGKGGKNTLQRLTPAQAKICDDFIMTAVRVGIPLDDRILTKAELANHIDFHSIRAERARMAYDLYKKRIETEGRGPITKELISRWNAFNPKEDAIHITQNGDYVTGPKSRAVNFLKTINMAAKPYLLRGDNRLRALEINRPVKYDRLALLATSVFALSHWRTDVTVTHYML